MEYIRRNEAKDHQVIRKERLDAIGLRYITSLNIRWKRTFHLPIGKNFWASNWRFTSFLYDLFSVEPVLRGLPPAIIRR